MIRNPSLRQVVPSESDTDALSLVIVEDLLINAGEWRGMPDIVRVTLKALSEVVKSQSEAIKELERQNISNVKLQNLEEYLDSKANTEDVKESLGEIVQMLREKPTFEEINTQLGQYSLKDDVDYALSLKSTVEETRELKTNCKVLSREVESAIERAEQAEQLIKQFKVDQEIEVLRLSKEISIKANLEEMTQQLNEKANKKSVASALQRKMNRSDADALLARKAETKDIQNLLLVLEGKADYSMLDSKADSVTVERLRGILETKADKHELSLISGCLDSKAERSWLSIVENRVEQGEIEMENLKRMVESEIDQTRSYIEEVRQEFNNVLKRKAEDRDLDNLIRIVETKAGADQLIQNSQQLRDEMARQINESREELMGVKRALEAAGEQRQKRSEQALDGVRQEIQKVNEGMRNWNEEKRNEQEEFNKAQKQLIAQHKREIQKDLQDTMQQFEASKKENASSMATKMEKEEFSDFKVKVLASLEDKTDLNEVQSALNACQADVSQRFIELKDELRNLIANNEQQLLEILDKKANFVDLQSGLALKTDNANLLQLLANKVSHSEIEETRKLVERVSRDNEDKVLLKDFEAFQTSATLHLEELSKDSILKANIKDVCSLLDGKSNIEDVNRALGDIHRELEKKSFQEDINNIVSDQAAINEQLCTENIVARWTWKSGEVKTGSLVPWEVQLVNTLPDNFLWEKEKTVILVVAPGLYEVTLGFFAKKKPTIQMLVNGEPIMSAVNTGSYVMHHSSGKIKDIKHSAGVITGLTLVDFILLPARARISLTYTGEFGGEGFFGLKRL